ncbi:MAG: T9SS type A sorting domain-containing protein [Bacteroidota bacterium]
MSHFHLHKKWIVTLFTVCMTAGLSAQVMTNGAEIDIQAGAVLTIQGGLSNDGSGSITNNGVMMIEGDLTNNSSLNVSDGQGQVELNGFSPQTIGGSSASGFHDLRLSNPSGLMLDQDISVGGTLDMEFGNLDLNGQIISLSETASLMGESDTSRIFGATGEIQTTRDLGTPAGMNIANLGVEITSSTNMGSTRIIRGHTTQMVGTGNSIERYFDIIPANNSNLDADFRMYYFPSELNGQDANTLALFRLNSGATNWTPALGNSNVAGGYVEQSGIDAMALWTLSSDGTTSITDPRPELQAGYFPNPMESGHILHVTGLEAGIYAFRLFDARGRQVHAEDLQAFSPDVDVQVSLPHLALGMYTMQIRSEAYHPMVGKLLIGGH